MSFIFDARPSDSPFVEMIWRTDSDRAGTFTSIAACHWEMVFTRLEGKLYVTLRGPETRASTAHFPPDAEFFGIVFKLGAFLPNLPASTLVDADANLPLAAGQSFWLLGSAWQLPTFENADVFVNRLVRDDMLVRDPLVDAALFGRLNELSPRTIQRRFLRATGVTQGTVHQVERARFAAHLLKLGVPILDVVAEAGYADQPHLTRALRYYIGHTPTQIIREKPPVPLSFLFKTEPSY